MGKNRKKRRTTLKMGEETTKVKIGHKSTNPKKVSASPRMGFGYEDDYGGFGGYGAGWKGGAGKSTYTYQTDEKLEVKLSEKPKLVIPFEIWRDHLIMSHYARGEYTTCMKIATPIKEKPYEFHVVDYFLPTQKSSGASAEWTVDGVKELVGYCKGDIADWYGVFHIHPGGGSTVSMSGIDVAAMWKWAGASKRGIFLVSTAAGARDAWLVVEVAGVKMQIPMEFDLDYVVNSEKSDALKKAIEAKVHEPSYAKPAYAVTPANEKGLAYKNGEHGYWKYEDNGWIWYPKTKKGEVAEESAAEKLAGDAAQTKQSVQADEYWEKYYGKYRGEEW